MANYIEQATLRLQDEATPIIRGLNAELTKLYRKAQRGATIQIRYGSINQAIERVRTLRTALSVRSLPNRSIRVTVNTSEALRGIANLRGQIQSLSSQAASIRVRLDGEGAIRDDIRELRARIQADEINIRINFPGIDQSIRRLRELNAELTLLQGQSRNINVNTRSRSPGPINSGAGPNSQGIANPYNLTFGQGLTTAFNPGVLGRRMGVAFSYAVQGELAYMFRSTMMAAAVAPLDLDTARARVRTSGRSEAERIIMEGFAADASQAFPASSTAEILANAVEVTGTLGDISADPQAAENARLAMFRVAESAQVLAATLGISSEQAADFARRTEKTIQILGAAADPAVAAELQRTVLQAVIASGGDFNPSEAVRTLQQLGGTFRAGLSERTMLQALLLRDEGGRMGTAEIRMAFQDMTRGNLNNDDMAAQIAVGLRDSEGRSLYADRFQADALEVVRNVIIPMLTAEGVDINNPQDVAHGLDNLLGFTTSAGRFFSAAIADLEHREAEVARGLAADPDYAISNPTVRQRASQVEAQFANLSSAILEPLIDPVNQGLQTVAESLNALSRGEAGIRDVGTSLAAMFPIGLYAGLEGLQEAESRPLAAAGLSLMGSAVALDGAAAALIGAAGVGTVADVAGGGGSRGGGILRFLGLASVPVGLAAISSYLSSQNESIISELQASGANDRIQSELTARIAETTERADAQAARLRGTPAPALGALPAGSSPFDEQGISAYLSEMEGTFNNGAIEMQSTFSTGAMEIAAGGDQFGQTVASIILAAAPGFGSTVAGIVAGAVSNINVNVNAPRSSAPRLDTGTTGPQ